MARRKKGRKRRKRRSRRSARWDIQREIARTLEREGITAENWQEKAKETIVEPRALAENFAAYVDANADKLGPKWAALLMTFQDYLWEDAERVVALYEQGLAAYPPCHFVEANMGDVYFQYFGQINRAKRHYKAAAALGPDLALAHYSLGQVYHLLGIFDRAEAEFELAAQCAGEDENEVAARSLYNVGAFHINRGAYEEGERYIRRALALLPDYPQAQEALRQLTQRGLRRLLWP
ncbi:MAG: tetratricopeptide repeat protein [Anaerolineae bacterium]